MKKRIVLLVLLIFMVVDISAYGTTIVGIDGKKKVFLSSDTRLTIVKSTGEKVFNDEGKKIFKLINGVAVAFAGDSYSLKKISSGKQMDIKSVNTVVNDLNNMKGFDKFTLVETVEAIAEKYVNILPEYSGEILIAGFEDGEARIYGIKAIRGKAVWQGIKGRGSFWAIGSGSTVALQTIKNNLQCDVNITNSVLGTDHIGKLTDKGIEVLLKKSMTDVINAYKTDFRVEEQTTGGKVDMVILTSQ